MPLLGWIEPKDRTPEQNNAHIDAVSKMCKFSISNFQEPSGPVKVVLTDFWKNADVISDVGFEFTGFHQLTGSCVGASAGNAVFTLAAVQRTIADAPTKAFVPWWPYFYGKTRYNEGDRGQGEGAVDSVMGQTLAKNGVFDAGQSGLPTFSRDDGLLLTERLEFQWSDGGSSLVSKWDTLASQHVVGGVAPLDNIQDVRKAIINGYPVLNGCMYYVGNGKIVGNGKSAYVLGNYDGRGGHSTCFLGYWDHPNDGPLYLYSNQWPSSTYPKDPAGAGRCCVWMKETNASNLFRYGGDNGETMALSHLNWFPAQPKVLEWYI